MSRVPTLFACTLMTIAVNAMPAAAWATPSTDEIDAAVLALLADEGKLTFDDRVIDHLPAFRMHEEIRPSEFT